MKKTIECGRVFSVLRVLICENQDTEGTNHREVLQVVPKESPDCPAQRGHPAHSGGPQRSSLEPIKAPAPLGEENRARRESRLKREAKCGDRVISQYCGAF